LLRAVLALALLAPASVASAIDAKVERMLKQLDPDARFEQICDLEAMQRIGKDKTYKPERSIVGADPKVSDTTMPGTGVQKQGPVVSLFLHMQDLAGSYAGALVQLPDRRADPAGAVGEEWAVVTAARTKRVPIAHAPFAISRSLNF
jgi:hypothetical protein